MYSIIKFHEPHSTSGEGNKGLVLCFCSASKKKQKTNVISADGLKPTFTCVSETEDSFLDCSGDTSWLNEELIKSSKRKTRNRSKRIRSFNMSSASSPPKRINENDSQLDPRSNIETNMICKLGGTAFE
uniref:CSON006763 protein n=1 Tax=Culicoides sonorensis TaxID=179676 RepID=A0A336L8U5_CULSO